MDKPNVRCSYCHAVRAKKNLIRRGDADYCSTKCFILREEKVHAKATIKRVDGVRYNEY